MNLGQAILEAIESVSSNKTALWIDHPGDCDWSGGSYRHACGRHRRPGNHYRHHQWNWHELAVCLYG